MKNLKDIVLKKGDKVYYYCNDMDKKILQNLCVDGYDGLTVKKFESFGHQLVKIERPTQYETIYEAPKQILDQKEKEYLENFLKPFKDRINFIYKSNYDDAKQIIQIDDSEEIMILPSFRKDTMYKGMELNKEYTLDELGLFKE